MFSLKCEKFRRRSFCHLSATNHFNVACLQTLEGTTDNTHHQPLLLSLSHSLTKRRERKWAAHIPRIFLQSIISLTMFCAHLCIRYKASLFICCSPLLIVVIVLEQSCGWRCVDTVNARQLTHSFTLHNADARRCSWSYGRIHRAIQQLEWNGTTNSKRIRRATERKDA